jgi:hypothetical protein
MTGPEHYRAAEQALHAASACERDYGGAEERYHLARAQVHATLALTAATVIQPSGYGCDRPEWIEWADVASVETAQEQRKSRVRINLNGGAR